MALDRSKNKDAVPLVPWPISIVIGSLFFSTDTFVLRARKAGWFTH